MGKKVTANHSVKETRNDDGKLTNKPYIQKAHKVDWVEITCYESNVARKNNNECGKINISENEEVQITQETFRADENVMYVYVDKAVEVIEVNKSESEAQLEILLREYNKQQIEEDDLLSTYCRVHGLDTEKVKISDLKKILKLDVSKVSNDGINIPNISFGSMLNYAMPIATSGITTQYT